MTVKELYDWCRAYRHKDAEVYLVKDWEQIDESGRGVLLPQADKVLLAGRDTRRERWLRLGPVRFREGQRASHCGVRIEWCVD